MNAPAAPPCDDECPAKRPTEEETEAALLRAAQDPDPVIRRYLAADAITAYLPTARLRSAWRAATRP